MEDNPSLSDEFLYIVNETAYNTLYHNKLISKYNGIWIPFNWT